MDNKIELCYDHLPTWLLKRILRNDLRNNQNPILTDQAINHICDILIERDESSKTEKDTTFGLSKEKPQARHSDQACGNDDYGPYGKCKRF